MHQCVEHEQLDWLAKWSEYTPDKVAFFDVVEDQNYTYEQCFQISNHLALQLQSLGVAFGDRVAVLSTNRIETIFLFFALQRLGAILVPINFRLSHSEVDFILQDSAAKILFAGEDLNLNLQKLTTAVEIHPMSELQQMVKNGFGQKNVVEITGDMQTPVKILYTSGTTGVPKGVIITHKILFWNSINTSFSLNVSSDDCMVSFLPLFHTGGWNVLLTPFVHRGAKTVFLPQFDADRVLQLCESEKATLLFGVPTTLAMMAKSEMFQKVDLSSVRYAVVGGEPMPLKLIQTWHSKSVCIRQGFGLTECGPNCFSLSEHDAEEKIGSIGRPNFYVKAKVVDENNQEVAVGDVGELLLSGPMCMTDYWQNKDATEKSFVGNWLRTGDLVKRDAANYFYVVGRKKEMFISGGENVYPAEVEKVLGQHELIDEVAVVGCPDEQWGEVGKAYIVTKQGVDVNYEDIFSFCLQRLAKFKIPKHIEKMDALPKGDTGKILKKQLQQRIYNKDI